MISRADGLRAASSKPSALSWWLPAAPSILWRGPLLLVLAILGAWFAFRGLVHVAFLFDRHPVATFLLAFLVLPLAALPALCFLAVVTYVPRLWRSGRL